MKLMHSCLPVLIESFMGQQMPPQSNSNNELQSILPQAIDLLKQIVNNQQNLNNRLATLETNAANQFTNLTNQVQSIKSIRLTHDRERKQIDYNLQPESEN
jgi:hypothetical protein